MEPDNYATQIRWTIAAYHDAAGMLMRVFGEEAAIYADLIRSMAHDRQEEPLQYYTRGRVQTLERAFERNKKNYEERTAELKKWYEQKLQEKQTNEPRK